MKIKLLKSTLTHSRKMYTDFIVRSWNTSPQKSWS